MSQQGPSSKSAETSFRTYLSDDICTDPNLSAQYKEKAQKTLADLKDLDEKGVSFTPFLEIGAGGVHRSTPLTNQYKADGVATDISQGALRNGLNILFLLGYKDMPMRICCDAHYLPFTANTFQFVFAYQTLHHYGTPVDAVAECFRVLGQGPLLL